MRLVLASSSPRRARLLDQLDLVYEVIPSNVDESVLPDEPAAAFVERLAREKAAEVASPGDLVIAADTVVVHRGKIMGKPAHPEEARSMLVRISGETHEVFTGVAAAGGGEIVSLVDVTEVRMLDVTNEELAAYVESGEPMDKAGAYALQGRGGVFVESVVGSPFTVIGLPIHLLPRLVSKVGGDLEHFRRRPSSR